MAEESKYCNRSQRRFFLSQHDKKTYTYPKSIGQWSYHIYTLHHRNRTKAFTYNFALGIDQHEWFTTPRWQWHRLRSFPLALISLGVKSCSSSIYGYSVFPGSITSRQKCRNRFTLWPGLLQSEQMISRCFLILFFLDIMCVWSVQRTFVIHQLGVCISRSHHAYIDMLGQSVYWLYWCRC